MIDIMWKANQICLTSVPGQEDNCYLGCGSLYYDWSTQRTEIDDNGTEKIVVDTFENPLHDIDFTELCTMFKGTLFENIYNELSEQYNIGRVRLIKSSPKTTMTWHVDDTLRIHYPIKTQDGCFMIIDNEVKHLPVNSWWMTNTTKCHTAVNASKEDRIHLIVNVL